MAALSDGTLVCVYRTTKGFPAISYSRDRARSWSKPEPMRYTPGGRIVRNPRACPKLWRCKNGKFLFWFHNNGDTGFRNRNPAWIIGGAEKDGRIHWSEPEILLYARGHTVRMSYPCLIEQDGRYWVTETQKAVARVHSLDATLLEGMWSQIERNPPSARVNRRGLVLEMDGEAIEAMAGGTVDMPELPDLSRDGGLTLELWLTLAQLTRETVLLSSLTGKNSPGIELAAIPPAEETGSPTLTLELSDGNRTATWGVDSGRLVEGKRHHVAFIVDGAADVISVVVDGHLCDGGGKRKFGWGRAHYYGESGKAEFLGDVSGASLRIARESEGCIERLRVYDRYLRTAEVVENLRAERDALLDGLPRNGRNNNRRHP